MKPACMTNEEYAQWTFWNVRILSGDLMAKAPCEDCTDAYVAEMTCEGKCSISELTPLPANSLHPNAPVKAMIARQSRMRQALDLLTAGYTQAAAARTLGLAPSTVSKYARSAERGEMVA